MFFVAEIGIHRRFESNDNDSLRSSNSDTHGERVLLNVYRSTDPDHRSPKPKKKSVAFFDGKLYFIHSRNEFTVEIHKHTSLIA
jgi:hypothetical protein